MSELVVVTYPDEYRAAEVLAALQRLQTARTELTKWHVGTVCARSAGHTRQGPSSGPAVRRDHLAQFSLRGG